MTITNNVMQKDSSVFVAGHGGLVGSSILSELQSRGFINLLTRSRKELDLRDAAATMQFFETHRPEYCFLAAAKVGGIHANNTFPAEFIADNLRLETSVIQACYHVGVKRLLFLGSSCVYPKYAAQPITEESLLTGALEPTNRPYAVAKIAGIEMCWAFNRQYGTQYLAVMPTNLYGAQDNFDPNTSHVIPAMIRKMHAAMQAGAPEVVLWGTGKPLREFLYNADLARACVFLMQQPDEVILPLISNTEIPPILNIGSGEELSIEALARAVAETVGFRGRIRFDDSMPDGTPRKLLDSSKINALGWRATTHLKEGLRSAYEGFLSRSQHPQAVTS